MAISWSLCSQGSMLFHYRIYFIHDNGCDDVGGDDDDDDFDIKLSKELNQQKMARLLLLRR